MDRIRTIEDFIVKTETNKILFIYGIGYVGKIVGTFLKNRSITVMAYVVTSLEQTGTLEDIPVCSLEEILKNYRLEDIYFIIAASGVNQSDIRQELECRNVDSFSELSEILVYEMVQENRKWIARRAEGNKEKNRELSIGFLSPGYLDTNYAEQRLIINKIKDVIYVELPKETARISCADTNYENDLGHYRQLIEACYKPEEYKPEVSLIHTFNTVCNTNISWCASFETSMPRMWPKTEEEKKYFFQLTEYMKQNNCKALYALCKNAYEIQKHHLSQYFLPNDVELLMKKTMILHPPQSVLITHEEFVKKHTDEEICFIFVGRAFFFKGGREVIQVLSEFESQYDFKLILISSLLYDDYFTKTPYEEMLKWKKIIQEKPWIEYYESLPNEKVLEKCREATVGLLPSVAETYGYAVLEMQAAGCPVVTTNIRAFPEINNEECGWICQIPVDKLGCCIEREGKIWSEILQQELRYCFQDIFTHPNTIQRKGKLALERIQEMHDPRKYQMELRKNLVQI